MTNEQYYMVCARRQAFDSLVWQTPPLAIAAQAFLLTTALDSKAAKTTAIALSILSAFVGLASLQLMVKHRQHEIEDSTRLRKFEDAHEEEGFSLLHGKLDLLEGINRTWVTKISSYKVWCWLLFGFFLTALYVMASSIER